MAEPDRIVFGLRIRSELALPDLFVAQGQGLPDLMVRRGVVDREDLAPGLHSTADGALMVIAGVGKYLARGGRELVIEAAPGADERNVRLYLLGSALGLILHQRSLMPLHANAIVHRGRAFALAGHSGSGKSTLAAWFHDRGFPILSDDVCVVRVDGSGDPSALPGPPRLRLWREALEASGRESSQFAHSYAGDSDYDKFDVPVAPSRAASEALPLAAVYLLAIGEGFSIEPLAGVAAAEALIANTYRGSFVPIVGDPEAHFRACIALASRTPLFRVQRTMNAAQIDEQARQILGHAETMIGSAG